MELTEDSFRALARSSPWRWRTLHLVRRDRDERGGSVEAWVQRPGQLVVVDERGTRHRVDERDNSGSSVLMSAVSTSAATTSPPPRPRQELELRPDGLVAARPSFWEMEHDDPMWQNYTWVAMLDPVELSDHTVVRDLSDEQRHGRDTWSATLSAVEGYDPRCTCCPLLWSYFSDRDEHASLGPEHQDWKPDETAYPEGYRVALDLQTGVVVDISPIGGRPVDKGFEVDVLEVDADLRTLFPPGRRRRA